MTNPPRLPNGSQRIVLIGRTGTGKTVAGIWHLSMMNLDARPWLLIDFKGDDHIQALEADGSARLVDYDWTPKPKDRGIHILRPLPKDVKKPSWNTPSPIESFIWKIHQRGNVGLFTDEGYMMEDNDAFNACQTQGRSLKIPMITCTQRPVWISRFCFSEADFIQAFHLNDKRDKQTVQSFVPIEDFGRLAEHHSFYYDVAKNRLDTWSPVPPIKKSLADIHAKVGTRRRYI